MRCICAVAGKGTSEGEWRGWHAWTYTRQRACEGRLYRDIVARAVGRCWRGRERERDEHIA